VLFGCPAYGLTTYRTGTNDTPFLFNGRYGVQSDANGLLYMQARYYNPYLCRFVSSDPSGFGGGLNTYAFAEGNPVSLIDPFGLGAHESSVDLSWFNAPSASQMQTQTILADFVNFATLGTANDASSAFTGRDLYGNLNTRQERYVAAAMVGMVFIPGGKAEQTASRAATELGEGATQMEFNFANQLGARSRPVYPSNDGFLEKFNVTIASGHTLDRFGSDSGRYAALEGTPYGARSLPSGSQNQPYSVYEVLKPINAQAGRAAPAFGEPGLGLQFKFDQSIQKLIDGGFLRKK
jgi:RHS repeat-associated protein